MLLAGPACPFPSPRRGAEGNTTARFGSDRTRAKTGQVGQGLRDANGPTCGIGAGGRGGSATEDAGFGLNGFAERFGAAELTGRGLIGSDLKSKKAFFTFSRSGAGRSRACTGRGSPRARSVDPSH